MKGLAVGIVVCAAAAALWGAESLDEAFRGGKVSGQLRAFWYDGQRELKIDRTAMTVGGILGYVTAPVSGLSAGVSFFSSNGILPATSMPYSGQTADLKSDGGAINVPGEAYIRYAAGATTVTYGRQRLETPLANDYYNRMLPNSFEALNIENRAWAHMLFKAIYITGWKYKADDVFRSPTYTLGIDRAVTVLGAVWTPWPSLKAEGYATYVPDVMLAPYVQISDEAMIQTSGGITVAGAVQYLREQSLGMQAAGRVDTYLLGLRGTVMRGPWSLSGLYTRVGNQSLLGTGGRYDTMGWGGFITFTDLQIDGETENAGATAAGAVGRFKPGGDFEVSAKYLRINQSDAKQADPASLTKNPRPDSDEYNLDATWQPRRDMRLRTRLARIDYDTGSTVLFKNKAYDETNVRIIADYLF